PPRGSARIRRAAQLPGTPGPVTDRHRAPAPGPGVRADRPDRTRLFRASALPVQGERRALCPAQWIVPAERDPEAPEVWSAACPPQGAAPEDQPGPRRRRL